MKEKKINYRKIWSERLEELIVVNTETWNRCTCLKDWCNNCFHFHFEDWNRVNLIGLTTP